MSDTIPFDFEIPVSFFTKADAESGKERRIGGVISTESKDRQGEVVLQRGLDLSPFLQYGWFNDNHSKATTDILGYPDSVKFVRRGSQLPDGSVAKADGHWAEGYLLGTEKANKVWELGQALQKTGRRLGYSIEGTVEKRTGPGNKTIAAAKVRNVAITNCPVNGDSRLEVLAKSMMAMEMSANGELEDEVQKTLGMGTATPGVSVAAAGPQTGMGAGRVLATQSLEHGKKNLKKLVQKSLSDAEAVAWVRERLPRVTEQQASRIVQMTRTLKRNGVL